VSLISALIAGLNTYVQWFFKSPSLDIKLSEHNIEWQNNKDSDPQHRTEQYPDKLLANIPLAFVNSGNQTILVQDMHLQLYGRKQPKLSCTLEDSSNFRSSFIRKWQYFVEGDGKTAAVPIITKPGEIVAHTIQFENIYTDRTSYDYWTGCVFFEILDPQEEISFQRIPIFAIVPPTYNLNADITVTHGWSIETRTIPSGDKDSANDKILILNNSIKKLNLQSEEKLNLQNSAK
jgi:hypothetical protein